MLNQNYNFTEKLLHEIYFKFNFVNLTLYEIEKKIFLKNSEFFDHHIFISSMARSGTTSLLNFLYKSNEYASLLYKDMPFILSLNLNKKLFKQNKLILRERYHNDGIFFDLNSPESFDEFFFSKIFDNDLFSNSELINYINLILHKNNKKRYLSKNNNNYKRISDILNIFPNSKFLITIRDPFNHSYSLMNQHINFTKLQKKNSFIKKYMDFLGHNEFGLHHKPWTKPNFYKDTDDINYWLEQWINFFSKIYKFKNKNIYFIIYEKLSDIQYSNRISELCETNKNSDYIFLNKNKKISKLSLDQNLKHKALEIYNKFYLHDL
tara:strand:- start:2150 stop:3115 length:966 start_codon:yes stop_codon:yes gene_type:complete